MMNNQFNATSIPTQHGIQMAQHVATSPPHASAAVINTFLNAQQQHPQLTSAGAIYGDPRQLQLNTNPIDKNYYTTTAATIGALGTPQRFYTSTNAAHHPNTILITNNFSHQQAGQPLNTDPQRNIRIVTNSSNPLNQTNNSNLATPANGYQHAQHVYNLNNNKQLQHLFPQHLLSQSNFQPATNELLPQSFAAQQFPPTPQQQQTQQSHVATSAIQVPHYYMSTENSITGPLNSNQKIINIPSNSGPSAESNTASEALVGNCPNTNNPTVVLDRINICINNLYTDTSSSSASNSLASTPAQQSSPIIPAIQHKPIIENGPALPTIAEIYDSNILVIDEPDSTTTATTPHTPPTTPESTPPSVPNVGNNANNNNAISTTSSINSPITSYNYQKPNFTEATKQSFVSAAQNIEVAAQEVLVYAENSNRSLTISADATKSDDLPTQPTTSSANSNASLTLLTPPSPELTNNTREYSIETNEPTSGGVASTPLFANGEDVFIKRHDDRFYLGTVIDTARNQFLVRFDDKTEVWYEAEQMRKLAVSSAENTSSAEEKSISQPMCVSCKRTRLDCKVEICERCGRGYHRKCTSETSSGSEVWMCKRCLKPMKLDETSKFSSAEEETEGEAYFHLHYSSESLTWDDKHRTNAEQIYCYCGKSGKFDHNMLQCWRCLNWYHTHCTQKFAGNILRGDCFFIFCCSVCNEGDEYLRRIQASWLDLVHLILYNLSMIKKHHKYHHLLKDINPYILEKRKLLPIPKEWMLMPEKDFLEKVKQTLLENTHLFMCGKEIKRDINSFALRFLEPPAIMRFSISSQDAFDDQFVFSNLKIPLLVEAPENSDFKFLYLNDSNIENTPKLKRKLNQDSNSHDVYEFEDTSDDEIPIKHILDKVKKSNLMTSTETLCEVDPKVPNFNDNNTSSATILEKMDVDDENANDNVIVLPSEGQISQLQAIKSKLEQTPKKEEKFVSPVKSPSGNSKNIVEEAIQTSGEKPRLLNTKQLEKSSRKRKAFTLSKSYNAPHLIDSSSDENSSSSSRGTSLDLIIPPPKNFLGQNNPFRIISPKKNVLNSNVTSSSSKKSVSFGIFNTTALNFSSKLAALKSAGLFPKLSTSNLAKAAGQPRTVRTIKRRLSAKDITIGPNKEIRRRRTRRLSSNIEVISTTTINPIPTNFFPIQAKDLLAAAAASTTTAASLFTSQIKTPPASTLNVNNNINSLATSTSSNTDAASFESTNTQPAKISQPTHGRRLRQRPQKISPNVSRRSSVSSNQSSTSSASVAGGTSTSQNSNTPPQSHEDFKQTVNKYFGIVNRIESGEQFSIRAKRQLANGQMQYLIEWGEVQSLSSPTKTIPNFADQSANSQLSEVSTTT